MQFVKGLGAQAAGRALGVADSFLGSSWKWLAKQTTKALKPSGMSFDVTDPTRAVLRYNPKLHNAGGVREFLGDLSGRAYNNARFLRRWAGRLNNYGTREINKAFPGHKNLGRTTSNVMKHTANVGLIGGLAELPFHFTDGGTDNKVYKVLHGVNSVNPFYHWTMNHHSPVNMAFSYTTPLGWAFTGAGKGMERIAEGYADASAQGARSAIDSTADALAGLKFSDRLGFLLSPQAAAAKYRSTALDQLSAALGQSLASSGDPDKDAALADLLRTI